MQPHLGQQQLTVCSWPTIEGKGSGDVTLGRMLGEGVTINGDFHHSGGRVRREMFGILITELNRGEHAVIERRSHQLLILLLDLSQK